MKKKTNKERKTLKDKRERFIRVCVRASSSVSIRRRRFFFTKKKNKRRRRRTKEVSY